MGALGKSVQKLTAPMRLVLIGLGVVVSAAVYYLGFYQAVVSNIEAALLQHERLTKELQDAKAAEQQYQRDLSLLAESERRQVELQSALPAETEYPAFLSAVQTAANMAGVSLAAWTPRKEVAEPYYARVPMRVELTGRFHQIARFFYNVGQLDRIINMEDISITDPVQRGDDVLLRAEVLATAFHAVTAAAAPADGAKERSRPKVGKHGAKR